MPTTKNALPQNLNPDGDICIPVSIPNDAEWLWLLHKAIGLPSQQRFWINDADGERDVMRHAWEARVATPFANSIIDGVLCSGDESGGSLGSCFRMDTTTEVFSFYPNDPFTDSQNDNGSAIATALKWQRWQDAGINGIPYAGDVIESVLGAVTGYFPNDIFITLDTLGLFDNPIDRLADIFSGFTSFPFPTVFVELEGEGQFEIELINVPFGGSALMIPDLELSLNALTSFIIEYLDGDETLPQTWVLSELNRDLLSVPPELVATSVHEFEFTGDERHTMHVVFIPRLDIEPPFYFPFGGVREIEVCGSLRIIGSQSGDVIDRQNFRNGQHVRGGVIGMSTIDDICAGVVCALEEVSSRILLADDGNVKNAVSIGTDGIKTVSVSSGSKGNLSVSGKQSRNGSAQGIYEGLNNWLADLQDFHDDFTGDIATATTFMRSKYDLYDTFDTKYQNYYNYRLVPNGVLPVFLQAIVEELYCGNMTHADVISWIIDSYSGDKVLLIDLLETVSPIQWTIWSNNGSEVPLDDYISFACNPKDPFNITLQAIDFTNNTLVSKTIANYYIPAPRYLRVTMEGAISLDSLNYHDGLFNWTNGDPVYSPILIGGWHSNSGAVVAWGTEAITPVAGQDIVFTTVLPLAHSPTTQWYQTSLKRNIALPTWATGQTLSGLIKVTYQDLGQIQ